MRLLVLGGAVGVFALVAALAYAYYNRDDEAEGVLWRSLLTALGVSIIGAAVVVVAVVTAGILGRLD